jgi:anti-sigma B factor antagonist
MMIVLRPQGKLDLVGASALQQKVERVANFASITQKTWVIDLEKVDFINHFGLTALVVARRYAKNKNCQLLLRNIKPPVQLMLEIAQLDEEFEIAGDDLVIKNTDLEITDQPQREINRTAVSLETNGQSTEMTTGQLTSISNLQRILSNFKNRLQEPSDSSDD